MKKVIRRAAIAFVDSPEVRLKSPNITTGPGGVVSDYNEGDWVRAVRHGVAPSGRPLRAMPSEDYNRMSDVDLAALVGYVRTLPPVPGEPAERTAGLGADNAIDGDAGACLQPADRLLCGGPRDPVDRAPVEPTRVQADLEGGYARIGCRRLGDEGRGSDDDGQREGRPDAHGTSVFATTPGIPW